MTTVEQAMEIIVYALRSVFGFVSQLFNAFGVWGWLIGGFTIYTIARILLAPIVRGAFTVGTSSTAETIRNKAGQAKARKLMEQQKIEEQ